MLCCSTVTALEPQKTNNQMPLLQNPFSSKPSGSTGTTGVSGSAPAPAQSDYILTLTADRNRVYYQGKIRFDATLTKKGELAEPVKGATIIFRNLQVDYDTRQAVTNAQGKATAGAYATIEPPEVERWIAETTINGKIYSSQPVSVQVLNFEAPEISYDPTLYINPFSEADLMSFGNIYGWVLDRDYYNRMIADGWTYDPSNYYLFMPSYFPSFYSTYYPSSSYPSSSYYPSYYPSFTLSPSGDRPYFSLFPTSGSNFGFPLFTS